MQQTQQQECPKCNAVLERSGELKRHCNACDSNFTIKIDCPDCGEPVQRLKACGAVNLWCDACNELKSKSTAIYSFVEEI